MVAIELSLQPCVAHCENLDDVGGDLQKRFRSKVREVVRLHHIADQHEEVKSSVERVAVSRDEDIPMVESAGDGRQNILLVQTAVCLWFRLHV